LKFDPEVNPILEKISSIPTPIPTRDFAFEKGIEFYKKRKFFETHEIFEFQWKKEKDELKLFMQALIQVAIAMNKVFINPNLIGAKSQSEKAISKLEELSRKKFFTEEGILFSKILISNLSELVNLIDKNLELNSYKEISFEFEYKNLIHINFLV
jgi:uncharacterized protein